MLKTLLNPARMSNESFDNYSARRRLAKRYCDLPVYQRAGELEFLSWL
jgi:3-deoxy-D-manno-octulosonic-acid transferase